MINFFRKRFLRRDQQSQKGTTAIEMALIAPVFIIMFMGLADVSLMMLAQHMLENATFNASRLGKTGYAALGSTQEQTVIDKLNGELGGLYPLIDTSKVSFSYVAYGSLSDIGRDDAGTTGLGVAQQVVVYTVSYPWKFFTPVIGEIMGGEDQTLTLTARLVVRNEPY